MSTNEPMSEERLDAIQARVDGATTSPWDDQPNWTDTARVVLNGDGEALWDAVGLMADADSEFIAHAREDIPALLAEVHRLRAELAKARAVTEDKVERVQKIMIDESFLAHEPDPHIRDVVREGIREQARLHVEAALGGGDDA